MASQQRARRQQPPRWHVAAAIVAGALLLSSCGDNGTTDSADTPLAQAQENVARAQKAVDRAQSEFDDASVLFCGDSKALIETLDQYGQLFDDEAVTIGEVKSGAEDLNSGRAAAGSAAESVLDARAQLDEAEADLATAEAELEAVQSGDDTESTDTTSPRSAVGDSEPLVPAAVTEGVKRSEDALADAAESVNDKTPVAEAAVTLNSAAFAVEVAWLQLFAAAGCLDDDQQAKAVQSVTDYTSALQSDLHTAHFYFGAIDGIYGPSTVEAVEQLQEAAGLPVTGLLDTATERALDAAVEDATGSALAGATTHAASIQGALKVLGYWDGPVDGAWSEELSDAIVKLQEDLGVEATGVVDTATLRALEDALAEATTKESTTTTIETSSTTSVSTTTEAPAG